MLVVLLGCGGGTGSNPDAGVEPDAAPDANPGEVVLGDRTRLLDNLPGVVDISVSDGELLVEVEGDAALLDLRVGDVIVGTADGGYLRKIESIETVVGAANVFVRIRTAVAALADAIKDGDFSASLSPSDGFGLLDLSGPLIDQTIGGVPVRVELTRANVGLQSTRLEIEGSYRNFRLTHLDVKLVGGVGVDLAAEAEIGGTITHDAEVTLPLGARFPFAFSIGPVPVQGAIVLDTVAGTHLEFTSQGVVNTAYTRTYTVEAGATYADGTWTPYYQDSVQETFTSPTLTAAAHVKARAYLRPTLKTEFYFDATEGPGLEIEPYVEAELTFLPPPPGGEVRVGLDERLRYKLRIFSLELAEWTHDLGSGSDVVWSGTFPWCGDDACDAGFENATSCPADCDAVCGDGACSAGENAASCSADCPDDCGDLLCTGAETASSCPGDCPDDCGDLLCTGAETASSCPGDCPDTCGDLLCTGGETAVSCPGDCPDTCGDTFCTGSENNATCPGDCPPVESCDYVDNDSDGLVDEGFTYVEMAGTRQTVTELDSASIWWAGRSADRIGLSWVAGGGTVADAVRVRVLDLSGGVIGTATIASYQPSNYNVIEWLSDRMMVIGTKRTYACTVCETYRMTMGSNGSVLSTAATLFSGDGFTGGFVIANDEVYVTSQAADNTTGAVRVRSFTRLGAAGAVDRTLLTPSSGTVSSIIRGASAGGEIYWLYMSSASGLQLLVTDLSGASLRGPYTLSATGQIEDRHAQPVAVVGGNLVVLYRDGGAAYLGRWTTSGVSLGAPTAIGSPVGRTTLAVDDNDIFVLADGASTSLARLAFDGTLVQPLTPLAYSGGGYGAVVAVPTGAIVASSSGNDAVWSRYGCP